MARTNMRLRLNVVHSLGNEEMTIKEMGTEFALQGYKEASCEEIAILLSFSRVRSVYAVDDSMLCERGVWKA